MALRVVKSGAYEDKGKICVDDIAKSFGDGYEHMVIVPAHYSHETEKRLAHRFKVTELNGIRALTVKKLARELGAASDSVLTNAGKLMLMTRAVNAYRKNSADTQLTRAMEADGFAAAMSELLTEFKRRNISAEDLGKAADGLKDTSRIYEKTKAAAGIFANYDALLKEGNFTDSDDDTMRLALKIAQNKDRFKNTKVYFVYFDECPPDIMSLVKALNECCAQVSLYVDCPETPTPQEREIYEPMYRMLRELGDKFEISEDIFVNNGDLDECTDEVKHFLSQYDTLTPCPAINRQSDITFCECRDPYSEAEYIAGEIKRLSRQRIHYRDMAVLFGDAASYAHIIKTVFSDYEIPFYSDEKLILSNHPIAVQISSVFDIVENNWSYESVFNYLHAGYIYEPNADETAKRMDSDEIDLLELYVQSSGIRGRNMWLGKYEDGEFRSEPWKPYKETLEAIWGDEGTKSQSELKAAKQVNAIRQKITEPFKVLAKGIYSDKDGRLYQRHENARYFAKVLMDFLNSIYMYEGISADIEALERGETEIADAHSEALRLAQVWSTIMSVTDQVVLTSGDEEMSFADFGMYLCAGLSRSEISIVPSYLDAVFIGTAERSTAAKVKVLFVGGAVSNTYPSSMNNENFFSNNERALLNESGLSLGGSAADKTALKYFRVYRALCAVKEKLYFSCPVQDSAGKALRPARLYTDTRAMFPNANYCDNLIYDPEDSANITSETAAMKALLINCSDPLNKLPKEWKSVYRHFKAKADPRLKLIDQALKYGRAEAQITPETAHELYCEKADDNENARIYSASKLETFIRCPMSYFLRYGLGAEPEKSADVGANHVGTYAHKLLQTICERIDLGDMGDGLDKGAAKKPTAEEKSENWNKWRELGDKRYVQLDKLIDQIVAETIEKLNELAPYDLGLKKRILARIKKTVEQSGANVINSIIDGEFLPMAYELGVFRQRLGESDVYLNGKIDRIDAAYRPKDSETPGRAMRIIDYKTGSTKFSMSKLKDGLQLQLMLYALMAKAYFDEHGDEDSRGMQLSGIYYQPVRDSMISAPNQEQGKEMRGASIKMSGTLFAKQTDSELAKLYSRDIENAPNKSSRYAPIKLTKTNGLYSTCFSGELDELANSTIQRVKDIDASIMHGVIKQEPASKAGADCIKCDFRDICMFNEAIASKLGYNTDSAADDYGIGKDGEEN